jgi:predicted GNAT family acetyltransferase
MMDYKLFDNYSIKIAEDAKEFAAFFSQNRPVIFSGGVELKLSTLLTEQEKSCIEDLSKSYGTPYKLRLYILNGDERIGWFLGEQKDKETFYMINTGIFKQHQNKGIYKSLLPKVLEMLRAKGFQKAYSKHLATNNQVIIPKLRQGFVITSLEVNDIFGVLVQLTYYFNAHRQRAIEYRVGQLRPDNELKQALSLDDNQINES